MNPGGNPSTLRPCSPSEARMNGAKGGVASGAARRERRRLRDALEILLSRRFEPPAFTEVPIAGMELDGAARFAVAVFEKAIGGDMRAVEFIRDTIGEKPVEQMDVSGIAETQAKFTELLEMYGD